jgi:hypothetical protein
MDQLMDYEVKQEANVMVTESERQDDYVQKKEETNLV